METIVRSDRPRYHLSSPSERRHLVFPSTDCSVERNRSWMKERGGGNVLRMSKSLLDTAQNSLSPWPSLICFF